MNELKSLKLTQGSVIMQVVDRKAMINKYVAAVIKRNIDFSRDTYSAAYNKFSAFISANPTSESLLKNAKKNGYTVTARTSQQLSTTLQAYAAHARHSNGCSMLRKAMYLQCMNVVITTIC